MSAQLVSMIDQQTLERNAVTAASLLDQFFFGFRHQLRRLLGVNIERDKTGSSYFRTAYVTLQEKPEKPPCALATIFV